MARKNGRQDTSPRRKTHKPAAHQRPTHEPLELPEQNDANALDDILWQGNLAPVTTVGRLLVTRGEDIGVSADDLDALSDADLEQIVASPEKFSQLVRAGTRIDRQTIETLALQQGIARQQGALVEEAGEESAENRGYGATGGFRTESGRQ